MNRVYKGRVCILTNSVAVSRVATGSVILKKQQPFPKILVSTQLAVLTNISEITGCVSSEGINESLLVITQTS